MTLTKCPKLGFTYTGASTRLTNFKSETCCPKQNSVIYSYSVTLDLYFESGNNFIVKCFWWPNLFYKGYLSFFEDDNVTIALMLDKAQSTEKEDPLGRPNVLIDKTFET